MGGVKYQMNNIDITVQTILAFFGGVTCIVGGVSALAKLFNPIKKLKEKVEEHEHKLSNDYVRMNSLDGLMKEVENSNEVICQSLFVLLNHEITGNSVDKLKEQRDRLEEYLIKK